MRRSVQLEGVQRRFTHRWVSGICIGFALLVVNWVGYRLALNPALIDVEGSAAAESALHRLLTVSDILTVVSIVVLAALAVLFFRPLDRTMRAEGAWLRETEIAQAQEASRQRFGAELHEALEMATDERAIGRIVGEVVASALPHWPAELLLADSSDAHLAVRVEHPLVGRAGCDVGAPFDCPAVKRARAQTFPSSTAINACPHLRDRPGEPRSAHCVPVAFMGRSLGVLHVTGPDGQPVDDDTAGRLAVLVGQVGTHIGTVRAFAKAQLQASTDSLTGLPNRRTLEDELSRRLANGDELALAVADLDHFKLLNDTYGHESGDRALRLFADTIRKSLRSEDLFGRWGGEEFVIAFPRIDAHEARGVLDRARRSLAEACARAETPAVTASFGLSDTTASRRLDALVRTADEALLQAKQLGRDRVHHCLIVDRSLAEVSGTVLNDR